jgi:hypothetical protein
MPHLVVLQSGDDRVFATENARSRHDMAGQTVGGVQVVGFMIRDRGEVRGNILAEFLQIRFRKRFDARRDALVRQNDDGHAVLARQIHRLDRRVKTILHIRRGNDDPRGITMATKAGDVQVGLLDVGWHTRGRAAPLHIDNYQRHFGHDRPTQRLGFEGNARPTRTSDRNPTGVTGSNRH